MFKIILLILFFISTVIVKLLSILLPINGQTSGEIFNRLPVFFTPCKLCVLHMDCYFHLISLVDLEYDERLSSLLNTIPSRRVLLYGASSILYILYVF